MSRSEAEVLELLKELCAMVAAEANLPEENWRLSTWEVEAFPSMQEQVEIGRPLSPKQMEKVLEAADRLQLQVSGENLFSSLPEQRQRAERKRAAAVVLPWEKGLMARPLRPPGR